MPGEELHPYTIRRISLASAVRTGCLLGWLAALIPALCLAGLAVWSLDRINQAIQQIQPVSISAFGQEILRLDVLGVLRLNSLAQVINTLASFLPATFLFMALALLIAGAIFIAAALLLVCVGYNWLAAFGWGLNVDLQEGKRKG